MAQVLPLLVQVLLRLAQVREPELELVSTVEPLEPEPVREPQLVRLRVLVQAAVLAQARLRVLVQELELALGLQLERKPPRVREQVQ